MGLLDFDADEERVLFVGSYVLAASVVAGIYVNNTSYPDTVSVPIVSEQRVTESGSGVYKLGFEHNGQKYFLAIEGTPEQLDALDRRLNPGDNFLIPQSTFDKVIKDDKESVPYSSIPLEDLTDSK